MPLYSIENYMTRKIYKVNSVKLLFFAYISFQSINLSRFQYVFRDFSLIFLSRFMIFHINLSKMYGFFTYISFQMVRIFHFLRINLSRLKNFSLCHSDFSYIPFQIGHFFAHKSFQMKIFIEIALKFCI